MEHTNSRHVGAIPLTVVAAILRGSEGIILENVGLSGLYHTDRGDRKQHSTYNSAYHARVISDWVIITKGYDVIDDYIKCT